MWSSSVAARRAEATVAARDNGAARARSRPTRKPGASSSASTAALACTALAKNDGPGVRATPWQRTLEHDIDVIADAYVLDIDERRRVKLMTTQAGVSLVRRAVVLAMGRASGPVPPFASPARPAGIFTAGLAQRLVNLYGLLPGRRAVILGSGDIGLIMARRLTLEGIKLPASLKSCRYANGLNRNIVQCLHDFDIPLHLSTTVVEIRQPELRRGVTVAPLTKRCNHAWIVRGIFP